MPKFKSEFLLLGLTFVLLSCNSVKVLVSEKSTISPGVSTAKPYYKYAIQVSTKKEIEFLEIKINNTESFKKFSVVNLATKEQGENDKKYPKGTYTLFFFTEKKSNILKDELEITYKNNDDKIFTLQSKIDTLADFQLR